MIPGCYEVMRSIVRYLAVMSNVVRYLAVMRFCVV